MGDDVPLWVEDAIEMGFSILLGFWWCVRVSTLLGVIIASLAEIYLFRNNLPLEPFGRLVSISISLAMPVCIAGTMFRRLPRWP